MGLAEKKKAIKQKLLNEKYSGEYANPGYVNACVLIDKMDDARIPNGYWFYKMEGFKGSVHLKSLVENYTCNMENKYLEGAAICLAGTQGTGKTASAIIILKEALKNNYSCLYTNAVDIFNDALDRSTSQDLKKRLKEVDFLVIDELDSRFFPSNATKELFSGIYENVFRFRCHNNMPTIICTNETAGLSNVFYGMCVTSIDSLNSQYLKTYPIAGKDLRNEKQ